MNSKLPRSVWIPLVALSLVIFGWRLNTVTLTNWDEGIYANVNLELYLSHDWTKLTYFGADFLEKPPLQFWLTTALFRIMGTTELAVRLIPSLAGVATVLLLGLWTWQATRNRWMALAAGSFFVLGRFVLAHSFRTGDLDGLLVFSMVVALYSYWRAPTAPRWMIIWGAAGAAAVMTKSFVGLLPLVIVGIDVLLSRGWRKIGWGNIAWAVGVFMALVTPWHIIETVRFGQAFWDSYLGKQVVDRTTDSLFTTTPWHYYFGIIRDRFAPFSFFLPLAIVTAAWRTWSAKSALDRLLLVWLLVTFIIFTIIQTRREWYILPFYPAAALLLAITLANWWRHRQSHRLQIALIVCGIGAFGHLLTDMQLRLALEQVPILRGLTQPWWRSFVGQVSFGAAATALIAAAAALIQVRRRSMNRWGLLGSISAGMMTMAALASSLLYIRGLPSSLPLKIIAARIEQEKVQNISLIGTRLKKQPAGYFYILRLDTHSQEYEAGTPPPTPLVVTTTEAKNAPLNTAGNILVSVPPLLLLDLR